MACELNFVGAEDLSTLFGRRGSSSPRILGYRGGRFLTVGRASVASTRWASLNGVY